MAESEQVKLVQRNRCRMDCSNRSVIDGLCLSHFYELEAIRIRESKGVFVHQQDSEKE